MNSRAASCALSVLCSCFVFVAGCSKDSPPPAATTSPAPGTSAESANRVVGKAPPAGSGIPVVIVLDPKPAPESWPQTEKPVLDQVSLTFIPPMLFVRTNQPAEFWNSDDTLHNVHVTHVESREPQFNVAIPTGEKYQYTFKREGFYHVGCDIHPAMSAEIFASSSPYVAVAASDGSFTLEDVPPGSYVVAVYAGMKHVRKDVTVTAGETRISIE